MKQIVLALLLCLFVQGLHAQITEKYYGTAARSEIVLDSKLTFSKGTISVGYSYAPSSATNTDCLIFLTDSIGNVVWEVERTTPNTDKYYAVIQTYDSNYVAVGSINAGSFYSGNIAVVTKFNQAGIVIWEKQFQNTAAGEVLYDVIERPGNHHLIAAGSYNFTPGANSGMLVDLTNFNGAVNWIKSYDITGSNQFNSLAIINNLIYVIGFYQGISYYDGYLAAVNEFNGNLNWSKSYDFTSGIFPNDQCNWFTKIQSYNNDVYINNYITNDYVNSQSQTHAVLRIDTAGNNPLCLEMHKPGCNYSNDSYAFMYNNRLYTIQHSGNVQYSPNTGTGLGTFTEASVSKMTSLNATPNPLVFSKKIGNTGDQGLYSLNVAGGKILCNGLSVNDPAQIGNVDIFSLKSDTNLISNNNCIMVDTALVFSNPGVTVSPFTFTTISNLTFTNTPVVFTTTSNILQNLTICYDALVLDTLQAAFTFAVPNPCDSSTIQFTDSSLALHCNITSWHWDFGDGDTSSLQNPLHQYTNSGTYSVTLIIQSNTGKLDTVTSTLNVVHNSFSITATANPSVLCPGESTRLTASGAYSYVWTGGVKNGVPFVPGGTATYTVTASNAIGCTETATVTVTVYNPVVLTILPDNPAICIGDSIQLTVSGASTYVWSPNNAISSTLSSTPIFYPTSTTAYVVTGTDANGCTGSQHVNVAVITDPKILVSKSGDMECNVRYIQLTASGADFYSWSPASLLGSPNAASTQATITQDTTFIVVGTIATCEVIDSIRVHVYNDDASAIYIPNAFSPNGDGINDCLHVMNTANFMDFYFAVYNRWGQKVFESDISNDCWDGNYKNSPAPSDTYYYYLKAKTHCGDVFKKGDIILIR